MLLIALLKFTLPALIAAIKACLGLTRLKTIKGSDTETKPAKGRVVR